MDSAEFREHNTSRSDRSEVDPMQKLALYGLGVAGEAGEVADEVKKILFHDKPLDRTKLLTEIGDVLWYLDRLTRRLDATLEDAMEAVTDKLNRRYPDGWAAADKHFDHTEH